jgi:DNA-binding NarL/FixJ family response regulator
LDDHDIVRRGLRDLLVNANDIDVIGDSGSVREAIPDILSSEADVMLLDLQLPDGSGVEVCRAVRLSSRLSAVCSSPRPRTTKPWRQRSSPEPLGTWSS